MLKRSELPNEVFGIPEERKYPMPDKRHTLSAIKLFGHVEDKYEKELAKNIIKNMKKFNIPNDAVGDNNRLKKYLNEETEYGNNAKSIYDKYGFKVYEEFDSMYYMTIDKNINESVIEEGVLSKITMSIPVKKYNKSKGITINNTADLVYYHKNPGVEHMVDTIKNSDDLRYLKNDTKRIIPTLEIIKTRIPLCKNGENNKNEKYYKGIKKMYLDRGLKEKDVELTIKWVRDICNKMTKKIKDLEWDKIAESGMAGVAPVIASPKPTEPTYIVNYMQNNVFTGSHQERFGICQSGMKNLHTFGGEYNRNHYTDLEDFEKEANHIKVYKYIGDSKNSIFDIIENAQTDMDYYRLLTGRSIDSRSDIEKDTDFVEEEYINDELSAIQECLYATAMADNINGSYLNSINESVEESRYTSILSSSYIIPMVNINEDGRIYNYYRDIDGVFVKNEVTGLRSKSYNDENDIRECVINLVKKGIVY